MDVRIPPIGEERIQQRTVEQMLDVPVSQVVKEIVQVVQINPQECLWRSGTCNLETFQDRQGVMEEIIALEVRQGQIKTKELVLNPVPVWQYRKHHRHHVLCMWRKAAKNVASA